MNAALLASVIEVWVQATLGLALLFHTKLAHVRFQEPVPPVIVGLSPLVISHVREAAKTEGAHSVSEMAARRSRLLRLDFMVDFWLVVLDLRFFWGIARTLLFGVGAHEGHC